MKAIVAIRNKQYSINEGSILYIDSMDDKDIGATVTFEDVLFCDGKVGTPKVEGCKVTAKVLKHGKQKKIMVLHHKPKKRYRKRRGHRQGYTQIQIEKIG